MKIKCLSSYCYLAVSKDRVSHPQIQQPAGEARGPMQPPWCALSEPSKLQAGLAPGPTTRGHREDCRTGLPCSAHRSSTQVSRHPLLPDHPSLGPALRSRGKLAFPPEQSTWFAATRNHPVPKPILHLLPQLVPPLHDIWELDKTQDPLHGERDHGQVDELGSRTGSRRCAPYCRGWPQQVKLPTGPSTQLSRPVDADMHKSQAPHGHQVWQPAVCSTRGSPTEQCSPCVEPTRHLHSPLSPIQSASPAASRSRWKCWDSPCNPSSLRLHYISRLGCSAWPCMSTV